ncbi:MAG: DUF192 domain-containing protein [Maricaulis sp.]|nr:DUF192 domain-containing protein [Maricaulis sp.]
MRSLILSLLVGLSAPAWAQDAEPAAATPDTTVSGPTAEVSAIAFGGPEPVVIDSADGRHVFTAELATTPDQLERGLMWRETLDPDAGMLFHYAPPRRTAMWMENTLIDLDLVFIAPDGEIVKIVGHAQAGSRRSLASDAVVAGVLELPAGRTFELGIRPGDTVRHAFFGNVDEGADDAAPAAEETAEETSEDTDAEAAGEADADTPAQDTPEDAQ